MTNKAIDRSTPVLRGSIYCSPRCGCRCTKAAYDAAVAAGEEMVALLGPKWRAEVWENTGWHVQAVLGKCSITDHRRSYRPSGFMLMLNVQPQIILHGDDPVALVGLAKQDARTHIARVEAQLAEIE